MQHNADRLRSIRTHRQLEQTSRLPTTTNYGVQPAAAAEGAALETGKKRGVSPDTAIRLEALLGASAQFWLNLHVGWDLCHAQHAPDVKKARKRIKRVDVAGL